MPHIHEKIDFCAEVFVVFKNKVLLRKHDKYKMWLSVGGHVELDEDPNTAAVREVKEEVGLDVELYAEAGRQQPFEGGNERSLIPPYFLISHQVNEQHSHTVFIYFARTKTDQLQLSESEITEECHWFSKEELVENKYGIIAEVQFRALKALEVLSE